MPIQKFSGVEMANIEDVSGVPWNIVVVRSYLAWRNFYSSFKAGDDTIGPVTWTFDGQNTTTFTSG